MFRKRRNQKEFPTLKTEVGKKLNCQSGTRTSLKCKQIVHFAHAIYKHAYAEHEVRYL